MTNGRAKNHKKATSLHIGWNTLDSCGAMFRVGQTLRAAKVVIPEEELLRNDLRNLAHVKLDDDSGGDGSGHRFYEIFESFL